MGSTSAGPVHSLPTEASRYEHRVQPGDFIDINLWEEGELKEYKVQVTKRGTISFLFFEDINVLGMTNKELDKHLTQVLLEYYVSPMLTVKIREVVYLLGEAKNPGAYTFEDGLTLAAILASAGGPTKDAKLKNVLVIRGYNKDPEVVVANFRKMLKKGDLTQNIYLKGGDIIFLPSTTIANVNYFVRQIMPILEFLMFPTRVVFP
ncbi:MAG: polysaccharide export protein [Deltaproteobacteria bacterium]|uniref:Polysaccharide export protein n=1 Tax=Candidatus Zymogenus saltonus TaxID=2844893 RepID=A0A9D8PMF3_9DELT|nr:polysaccharide export protein [Candidatus Zymogenus saltonus]